MNARQRYIALKARLVAERGTRCGVCGAPAIHPHHIIPVAETSIHAELVYEPANIMILCEDCHCLMHPNKRMYPWRAIRIARSRALGQ